MSLLEKAIRDFRDRRLNVYREDPDQITRDTNVAKETTRDHVGRWVYELIQNADDADASTLFVKVCDHVIYVADNGKGLIPDTVKSLSGTHISVKPAGAIGRKGLGFKSIYAITRTPQIFSHDDGIVFCPDRATAWLQEHGLISTKIPYQWLPFWLPRRATEEEDQVLASLAKMATVVKLPLTGRVVVREVMESLRALPGHTLLTFRKLRNLHVESDDKANSFLVQKEPRLAHEGEWSISDTRHPQRQKQHWRLDRKILAPPPEALTEFEDEEERRRASEASITVGALLNPEEQVVPLPKGMKLHVYYPTEEPSPIPLLLHADFVVKSDRTKVVPVEGSYFNSWISERLADQIVEGVDKWYSDTTPASSFRLMAPTPNLKDFPTPSHLWDLIEARAKSVLRLPDMRGNRVLTVADACLTATSTARHLARQIFAKCEYASSLVHPSLENDEQARHVLDKLGCTKLTDEHLFAGISKASPTLNNDREWLWKCWQWLAEWAAEKRKQEWKSDYKEKRLTLLKSIPILAIDQQIASVESLREKTVTWRGSNLQLHVPEWLPLVFIDDWLRNKVVALPADAPVRLLFRDLRIEEPDPKLVLNALTHAIENFWKTKEGDPNKFLTYILSARLHEQFDTPESLHRCPVRVTIQGKNSDRWVEARRAYFGREWGEDLIVELFDGIDGTKWVKCPAEHAEAYRAMLTWLGVTEYPRLVSNTEDGAKSAEKIRVQKRLPYYTSIGDIPEPEILDGISYNKLNPAKAKALICLLARQWRYYSSRVSIPISYKHRTWYQQSVESGWWEELKSQVMPPMIGSRHSKSPLKECWLPDGPTRKAIDTLIPIVDLATFGNEKQTVRNWLINAAGIRTRLAQLTPVEWRGLLSNRIPQLVSPAQASCDGEDQRVLRWYEACLDSLSAQETDLSLVDVPLLCRKDGTWNYIVDQTRWLADNTELAQAFLSDVWQIAFPEHLHTQALKYFAVSPLSKANVKPLWDSTTGEENPDLQMKLDSVKPFVFVWRCYKTKQDHDRLRKLLQSWHVKLADKLEAEVSLGKSIKTKVLERQMDVAGNILVLKESKADVSLLAAAIAKAVGTPSEADFYDLLLRCESDAGRIRKLEAHNCSLELIQRLLQEYHASSEVEGGRSTKNIKEAVTTEATDRPKESELTGATVAATPIKTKSDNAESSTSVQESQTADALTRKQQANTSDATSGKQPQDPAESDIESNDSSGAVATLSLKDLDQPVRVRDLEERLPNIRSQNDPSRSEDIINNSTPEKRDDDSTTQRQSLSHEQNMQIEKRGREFAARVLSESMGYEVKQMPIMNPGFDLLAWKGDETFRVEIKAHLRSASVIPLPINEYREYARWKNTGPKERWELWNIEHLAKDSHLPVTVTRFCNIPDDAVDAKLLRVDLRLCT